MSCKLLLQLPIEILDCKQLGFQCEIHGTSVPSSMTDGVSVWGDVFEQGLSDIFLPFSYNTSDLKVTFKMPHFIHLPRFTLHPSNYPDITSYLYDLPHPILT